jgi:hypothetical protein
MKPCKSLLSVALVALFVGCQREPAATTPRQPGAASLEEELEHQGDTPGEKPKPEDMARLRKPELRYEGRTLSGWVAESRSDSPAARRAAALALGNLGPAAIPTLTELLQDKDPDVGLAAALALKKIKGEKK